MPCKPSLHLSISSADIHIAMAKKKQSPKADLAAIERAAKRAAQKAQGALDGRFRVKKVESKKRYSRKRKDDQAAE